MDKTNFIANEYDRPSKSQKKRTNEGFRELAVELVAISPGRLARLDLPEGIRAAVDVARAMPHHGARRRQLSYIGGLLQEIDIASVKNAITHGDQLAGPKSAAPIPSASASPAPASAEPEPLSELEATAVLLLEGGDQELFTLADRLEPSQLQMLRQFVRKTKKSLPAGAIQNDVMKVVADYLLSLDLQQP